MLEKLNHQPDEPEFVIKAPDDVIGGELVCSETQHPRITHNGEHFLVPFSNIPPPLSPHFLVFIATSVCRCIHFLCRGKVGGAAGTQVLRAAAAAVPSGVVDNETGGGDGRYE